MMVKCPVELSYDYNGEQVSITSVCKDVSATGLLVSLDEVILKGTAIVAKVSSKPPIPEMSIKGKVLRVTEDEGRFEIAIVVV